MVRDEHRADDELREFCEKAGGEIQETLADDNDQVREGCVVDVGDDLATVVVPGGLTTKYQIQFGEFGKGSHHRETVFRPSVVAEVGSLEDASMPPHQVEFNDLEFVSFPRDNEEQFF